MIPISVTPSLSYSICQTTCMVSVLYVERFISIKANVFSIDDICCSSC